MPQLIGLPSRQSQNHRMPLINGVIVQPMIPAIKAKSSNTIQRSISGPAPLSETLLFKRFSAVISYGRCFSLTTGDPPMVAKVKRY